MYNEEYFINKSTCAIIPIDSNHSKVVELDGEFLVNRSVKNIINDSCKFFGSSYQGRFDGSKRILNMNYKLPIVVEESNDLIFFPTSSPRFNDCIWLSLNNITGYVKSSGGSSVSFKHSVLSLDISYYSLENQIFRATMLDSMIRKRKDM